MKPEVGSPIFEASNDGLGTIRFATADAMVLVSYLMDSIKILSRTLTIQAGDAWSINQMSRMAYQLLSSPDPSLTSLSKEDINVLRDLFYNASNFERSQLEFLHVAISGTELRSCVVDPSMSDSAGKSIQIVMSS